MRYKIVDNGKKIHYHSLPGLFARWIKSLKPGAIIQCSCDLYFVYQPPIGWIKLYWHDPRILKLKGEEKLNDND